MRVMHTVRRPPPHGRTGRTPTRSVRPPAAPWAVWRLRPHQGHALTQAMHMPCMLGASGRPGRVHSAGGAATVCQLTWDNHAPAPGAESLATPSG
jgi:hypothetical protein